MMSSLIKPHGGTLVDLRADAAQMSALREQAAALPKIALNERGQTDLLMLATGAMSPLNGFLQQKDYLSVRDQMRLADGRVWAMPINLRVHEAQAQAVAKAERVALTDEQGTLLAMMDVADRYHADKGVEARAVFGTDDNEHPGVQALMQEGDLCLGGGLTVLQLPVFSDFAKYRLEPAQTRAQFQANGWHSVVGFQTRNPIHRAHEYIQKCALELVDALLLHPLVGATKSDDVPADVRMDTYEVIFDHYYPRSRSMIGVFPAYMRYGGPREAIFHALCRKNYGCSHFIVGRDHAGVGNYYGTYDAQRIFEQFDEAEIGIKILCFEHTFFCKRCGNMASPKTCPHEREDHLILSGTEVRRMLSSGQKPPPEFTRPEVAEILIRAYQG